MAPRPQPSRRVAEERGGHPERRFLLERAAAAAEVEGGYVTGIGPMSGADAEGLRLLSSRLDQAARQLEQIRKITRARLYSSRWEGRDASLFTRAWESDLQPTLLKSSAHLQAAAAVLLRESEQQAIASLDSGYFAARGAAMLKGVTPGALGVGTGGQTDSDDPPWQRWVVDTTGDLVGMVGDIEDVLTVGAVAMWATRGPLSLSTLLKSDIFESKAPQLLGKTGTKVLAGAGIVVSGYEVLRSIEAGDDKQAIRSGISFALSVASVVPVTAPFAIPMNVAWTVVNIAYDHRQTIASTAGRAMDYVVRNPEVLMPPPVRVGLAVGKAALSLVDEADDGLRDMVKKFW